MADIIRQITYSLEITGSDERAVWPLAYYALAEIAPVVPQVGARVGATNKVIEVTFVRHQFSSEKPQHLHHHITVYGTICDTD